MVFNKAKPLVQSELVERRRLWK